MDELQISQLLVGKSNLKIKKIQPIHKHQKNNYIMRKKLNTLLVFSFLILNVFSMYGFPLYIRTSEGGTITLDVDSADLVENVKQKIQDNVGIAPDRQQLFFAGIELEDVRTLAYYNVQSESSLDLVVIQSMFPEGFNYQALARDSAGDIIVNTTIAVQFDLRETTAAGTIIYTETHNPTTNGNGVFNLVMGQGTTTFGVFNTIDWASDSHFLEVSIDPANGTTFTSLGTTQLLSVPYALHAKTAGSVTETQTLANVIAIGNTAGAQIKNVTDPTDAQDAATKAYVDALEAQIADLEARFVAFVDRRPAIIGDFRAGGVVFWVDPTDNTHGLVCAIQDQSTGIQWYNGSYITTGATGTAIGLGTANTASIISAQGAVETNYAAGLAKAYSGGGFNDWFLPSKDELNEMYLNKATIEATATANGGANLNTYYWSSTENDINNAWVQNFTSGNPFNNIKFSTANSVRAVRAF